MDEGPRLRRLQNPDDDARSSAVAIGIGEVFPVAKFNSPIRDPEGRVSWLGQANTTGISDCSLTGVISPNAYHSQFLSLFISWISPPQPLAPELLFFRNWLSNVPHHIGRSQALDHASQCLTTGYYGRIAGDEHAIRSSKQMYGQALRSLQWSINDDSQGLSSETLCATMLLNLYEVSKLSIDAQLYTRFHFEIWSDWDSSSLHAQRRILGSSMPVVQGG
jgi:Fungal specific transcription factor domain